MLFFFFLLLNPLWKVDSTPKHISTRTRNKVNRWKIYRKTKRKSRFISLCLLARLLTNMLYWLITLMCFTRLKLMCVAILLSECVRGNRAHTKWLKRHVHNRQMWILRLTPHTHTHKRTGWHTSHTQRNWTEQMSTFNATNMPCYNDTFETHWNSHAFHIYSNWEKESLVLASNLYLYHFLVG